MTVEIPWPLERLRRERLTEQGLSPSQRRCPECNARVGAWCYGETGRKLPYFHDARWRIL